MTTIQYKNEAYSDSYREEQLDEKGRLHGYRKVFDIKGQLLYEDWFSEGELHGTCISYINGKVITLETFENGECTTPFTRRILNHFRLWWYF